MPVMGGLESAHLIKSYFKSSNLLSVSAPQPYLVALSASEIDFKMETELRKCFDDWFTVPLSVKDIQEKIMFKIYLRS